MPLWGGVYFVQFGVPAITTQGRDVLSVFPAHDVVSSLSLIVAGAAFCLLFFYTPIGQWVDRLSPKLKAPWDPRRAPLSGVILCLIGLAVSYYLLISDPIPGLEQPLYILSKSSTLGMLTLFLLQLRRQLSFYLKIFLWGFLFPIHYLLGIGSGAVYQAVALLVPFFLCYAAERRRIPVVGPLLFILIFIIPFLGVKEEFRSYAWYGDQPGVILSESPLKRGLFFVQLVIRNFTEGGKESFLAAAETAQERTSILELLTNVRETTPGMIPFWKGETYATAIWLLVPRALFPNKPVESVGQEFGHRYGFIAADDLDPSVNLPYQIVEMYINFGVWGVLVGMALVGSLYRALSNLLGRPDSGERAILVGCVALTFLLNLDGSFTIMFGGMLYCLLILSVVARFFHGTTGSLPAAPA